MAAGKYALEEIANISGLFLDEVKKLKADRTAWKNIGRKFKKENPGLCFIAVMQTLFVKGHSRQKDISKDKIA